MIPPTWESDCGSVKLWRGDCLEVMESWPDGSVGSVVTDPPYSIQNEFGTQHHRSGTRALQWAWDKACDVKSVVDRISLSLTKIGAKGAFVVFCGSDQVGGLVKEFRDARFTPKMFVWVKKCPPPACPGNWWPSGFELGFYGYRAGAYFGDDDTKRSNVFVYDSYRHGQPGKVDHPTQKPLALMERLVAGAVRPNGLVADPFMGSGTTGVAAVRLGRKFYGCEIDPNYFEVAKRRILEEMAKKRFTEGGDTSFTTKELRSMVNDSDLPDFSGGRE